MDAFVSITQTFEDYIILANYIDLISTISDKEKQSILSSQDTLSEKKN
jgi:hypothetical protein